MKQISIILIASLFAVSCAPEAPTDELGKLKKEKDSLKEEKSSISERLAEIEAEIALLDTTKSLALVTTAKPEVKSFNHYFQVYGSLASDQNAQIYPELGGKIVSIWVKEGTRINKGQTIATLDVQAMREQESELKTRLELAETTYKKQKKLWDQKIGSEIQFLQAKNNYEALQNSLAALQANIAKGTITAPFAGVVDEIFPKEGEMAMPGMPIARLMDLSKMYIEADISENYIGKIKEGDNVVVSFPSLGIEKHTKIERLANYINPNNRTFKIRVDVENSDNVLKPNMVALVNINDFKQDTAVVVASSLIMEGAANKRYVFVVKSNDGVTKAVKQPVEVKMSYEGNSLVSSGLRGNEAIVDKGARSIRDGELVEVQQ